MAEVHVGDVGTTFRLLLKDEQGAILDLSGANQKEIWLVRPDKNVLKKTAVFTSDGHDGKIQYVMQEGDLDQAGKWQVQGVVSFANGNKVYTNIFKIKIFKNVA